MFPWLLVPTAYLVGSLPWGLIIVRRVRGVDVRQLGSGKTGVTNVLRAAGARAAVAVLVADAGKGALMVGLSRVASDSSWLHAAVASTVVVGHVWPVFAAFRGGRGIATGFGGAVVLAPWAALAGVAVFLPVVGLTRYVSLGSVLGVITVVAGFGVLGAFRAAPVAYVAYAVICGALIIGMHRDNLVRLMRGTERRLGG